MDPYKEITRRAYMCPEAVDCFDGESSYFFHTYLTDRITPFLNRLPGKKILDLASGTGSASLYFRRHGYAPACVDFSPVMVQRCRERKLPTCMMDVEFLGFAHEVFDGVWAQLGLNHLPKNKFPLALDEILRVLAPQGVLFLGMKQGDHEGYVSRGCFDERFSSCYRDDELRVHLERRFDLLDYFTVSTDRTNGSSGPIFLQYVCRKQ